MARQEKINKLLEKAGMDTVCPACGQQMVWTASDRYKCAGLHSEFWAKMQGAQELIRILPAGSSDPDSSLLTLLRGKERTGNTGWDNELLLWAPSWHYIPDNLDEPELNVWVNPKFETR